MRTTRARRVTLHIVVLLSAAILAPIAMSLISDSGRAAADTGANGLPNSDTGYVCNGYEDRRGEWLRFNYEGYVMWGQICGGNTRVVGRIGGGHILDDEPAPAIDHNLDGPLAVYRGDRTRQVNQPYASVVYRANNNNRVVQTEDGNYYREVRVRGQWQRSLSYGTDGTAARHAAWNARTLGADGPPLLPLSSTSTRPSSLSQSQCQTSFSDLSDAARALLCEQ